MVDLRAKPYYLNDEDIEWVKSTIEGMSDEEKVGQLFFQLTAGNSEEYLKEFGGSLIIVSHDRHFLDKLVDHLFIFCGNGVVKDFVGTYSEYREYIKEYEAEQKAKERAAEKAQEKSVKEKTEPVKRKLSYKEQKELEQIEKDLESLNEEKTVLEDALSSGSLPFDKLQEASARIGQIIDEIDEKELRWLDLSELA